MELSIDLLVIAIEIISDSLRIVVAEAGGGSAMEASSFLSGAQLRSADRHETRKGPVRVFAAPDE